MILGILRKLVIFMISLQLGEWKKPTCEDLIDHYWYLVVVEGYGTPLKAKYHDDPIPYFQAFAVNPLSGNPIWKYFNIDDVMYCSEMPDLKEKGEKDETIN